MFLMTATVLRVAYSELFDVSDFRQYQGLENNYVIRLFWKV